MGEKKERLEGGGRTTQKDQDMDLTVGKDPAHGDSRGQAWCKECVASPDPGRENPLPTLPAGYLGLAGLGSGRSLHLRGPKGRRWEGGQG